MRRSLRISVGIALLGLLGVALFALPGPLRPHLRSAAFVIQAAEVGGWVERAARWPAGPILERDDSLPTRHGSVRTRSYLAADRPSDAILLVPGLHAEGIDEPRVRRIARNLAGLGVSVMTIELPDLLEYDISPRSTDMIEDVVSRVAAGRALATDGRVGLVGVSFGGGLVVAAAGRPALRDRLRFVLSLGGHGDLPRVLRFLCTGVLPDGTYLPPHDYGVAVILLGVADRLVPAGQAGALRVAIRTFLEASHLDMFDPPRAQARFEEARALEAALPEPAATLMHHVNRRDVGALGPRLLPHIAALGGDPALSPERSPPPTAPVYLLHGEEDNVIPTVESRLVARHLAPQARVRLLVTPLLTHSDVAPTRNAIQIWRLIAFWGSMFGE